MPIIKILPHAEYCPDGAEIQAPTGTSICEALLDNGINIDTLISQQTVPPSHPVRDFSSVSVA